MAGHATQPDVHKVNAVAIHCDAERSDHAASREFMKASELYSRGKFRATIRVCKSLGRRFPQSQEAPAALQMLGEIYLRQHRFQSAFQTFRKILENYPSYEFFERVVALEFDTAQRLMDGQRNYFLGKIPGFKDREGAMHFFQTIVSQAPYGNYAPMALMHIATLAMRIGDTAAAIDALERIIDEHMGTEYAPRALLALAKVYRHMVNGPGYDQRATEDALNYFREFLILHGDSPLKDEAEKCLEDARNLLAYSKINIGNFYYDDRQNGEAAMPYYEAAIAIAPDSTAAQQAKARIGEICSGKAGRGSPLDPFLGRYRMVKNDK
ncbi:MAG: tetratricopeptide repeat protein [Puniceicoccales bacterium]|nr:tetratricopeptide repeat protein [Puniceicoccales bacterium]